MAESENFPLPVGQLGHGFANQNSHFPAGAPVEGGGGVAVFDLLVGQIRCIQGGRSVVTVPAGCCPVSAPINYRRAEKETDSS